MKNLKITLSNRLEMPEYRASSANTFTSILLGSVAILLSACVASVPPTVSPATSAPVMALPQSSRATIATTATTPTPLTNGLPYTIEKITLPGPVIAYAAKININDPRTKIIVALADDRDPDGAGPAVGQLTTTSAAAAKHNFHITMNASFFAAPNQRPYLEKNIRYFAGNGANPVGWHVGGATGGKVITTPQSDKLRATVMVHTNGKVTLRGNVKEMPADVAYAVSGNAMLLEAANLIPKITDAARAPRSAVGLSADGATLLLVAVDGRQTGYSVGASLYELAQIMVDLGAHDALNLDGGGSTSMVLKDEATGVFSLLNQPSDGSANKFPQRVERPVVDVIGVRILGR